MVPAGRSQKAKLCTPLLSAQESVYCCCVIVMPATNKGLEDLAAFENPSALLICQHYLPAQQHRVQALRMCALLAGALRQIVLCNSALIVGPATHDHLEDFTAFNMQLAGLAEFGAGCPAYLVLSRADQLVKDSAGPLLFDRILAGYDLDTRPSAPASVATSAASSEQTPAGSGHLRQPWAPAL